MIRPTPEELTRMKPVDRLPHLFGPLEWFMIGILIGVLLGG